ncbi:MAG: hypothetical protein MJZ76_01535 [Bacteroidales bacterium]|nr:hypothetical protein [Bacteroidales bacterium]
MATFIELYNDLETRIKRISLSYSELKNKKRQLEEENGRLVEENAKLTSQLSELKEKYRLLTITKTLAEKKDKTDTKRKINELVREIDNCIRLLNQ